MIYFVEDSVSGLIKIGYSCDPARRMVKMQSDSPGELRLLAVMAGCRATERDLHARFADQRRRGEWFTQSDHLATLISQQEAAPEKPARDLSLAQKYAAATGCSVNVTQAWVARARIPSWYWAAIVRAGLATMAELGAIAEARRFPELAAREAAA